MTNPSDRVVELRQYTLHPGQREVLLELFEREFIETQETAGMHVIGQFRDLDDPDRFVWLRGFPDMATRAAALQAFYGGPAWQAHRHAANATMIDSDNVLLLKPVGTGFAATDFAPRAARAAAGAQTANALIAAAAVGLRATPIDAAFVEAFEHDVVPRLAALGAPVRACFVTETSPNDFPRLPVREGEHAFVFFCVLAPAAFARWRDLVLTEWAPQLKATPQLLRLAPAARSHLQF